MRKRKEKTTATFWAQDGRIFIRSDYSEGFVADFKKLVPGKHRSWKPKPDKLWTCDPAYLDDVHVLASTYFDEVSILETEVEVEIPAGLNGADPYRLLLKHCPTDYLKKIHRAVILAVHPDKGGTQEQASDVNIAWDAIKQERGF